MCVCVYLHKSSHYIHTWPTSISWDCLIGGINSQWLFLMAQKYVTTTRPLAVWRWWTLDLRRLHAGHLDPARLQSDHREGGRSVLTRRQRDGFRNGPNNWLSQTKGYHLPTIASEFGAILLSICFSHFFLVIAMFATFASCLKVLRLELDPNMCGVNDHLLILRCHKNIFLLSQVQGGTIYHHMNRWSPAFCAGHCWPPQVHRRRVFTHPRGSQWDLQVPGGHPRRITWQCMATGSAWQCRHMLLRNTIVDAYRLISWIIDIVPDCFRRYKIYVYPQVVKPGNGNSIIDFTRLGSWKFTLGWSWEMVHVGTTNPTCPHIQVPRNNFQPSC